MPPSSVPIGTLFDKPVTPKWIKKISAPMLLAQQEAFNKVEFCATPGCEETKFTWCHVIPSSAQLSDLAEDNEVCWIPMRERDRWTMNPWWSQDPIARTIIFRGFCNKCDSSVFQKIDQPLVLDKETYALLAYRAACYFNWRAEVDLHTLELSPNKIREMVEGDQTLPPLKANVSLEESFKPELKRLENHRDFVAEMMNSVGNSIRSNDFNFLETIVLDFRKDLPCRYSVAAAFSTSLRHEHVDISQKECPPLPGVFLHLLDVDGTTKLILSWMKYVPERFPISWLDELMRYSESGHLTDVLLRYMFINNHGLVFRPSLVPTFDFEQAAFLTAPLSTAVYHNKPPQITRICEPPYFDDGWKLYPKT